MKEGLEKDFKKLDNNLSVKDGETNSETGKKKGKEERPPTKVVVRRLPPTMTEEEFLQQIEPLPPIDYMYYMPADVTLSPHSFCRAYLNFINQSDIFIFTQKFDGYVFVDSKGLEYPAIVEFAPFQRVPKQRPGRKKDPKAGTLESDQMYISFIEKLQAQIQENTSAGSNMKQHFFETNVNSSEENKVNTTPLLDYLRARHAERLRAREEKRKKDLERKRARDEQRKTAKKSEEESSVLKPPVISLKPKSEDERLMEQQTIFLRRLLGLPNPNTQVISGNCSKYSEDISGDYNSCSEKVVNYTNNYISCCRGDSKLIHDNPFYSNHLDMYRNCNANYLSTSKNGDVKTHLGNGYWKREMFVHDGSKTRKLWKQSDSKYGNSLRIKSYPPIKPLSVNKWEDLASMKFDKLDNSPQNLYGNPYNHLDQKNKKSEYSLEKELLDENALEEFPTFEESKLHRLQKNILKAPLMQASPIKKESVEEIKLKFQKWSHDVTTTKTSSSIKKKDLKKNDSAQVRIMKPPSRIIRNGINRMMRENDESRLELIYESIMKDDVINNKSGVNGFNARYGDDDYILSDDNVNFKNPMKHYSGIEVVSQQNKTGINYNSRFLVSNNIKLPKAFGCNGKIITQNNFCLSSNHGANSDTVSKNCLPKAFNSSLKSENNEKCNCHQSHRNITIGSSKGSSGTDNINRKGSPCSIIC